MTTATATLTTNLRDWMPRIQAGMFVVLLMYAGVSLYRYLADPQTLPIREVRVEGEFVHLATGQLEQRAIDVVTGGFFNVDVTKVQTILLEEPWVSRVSVRRVWPQTLMVEVRERTAVARWGKTGLLDTNAEVFYPQPDSLPQTLIQLNAPAGTETKVMQRFQQLTDTLGGLSMSMQGLELSERGAWSFRITDGPVVMLGRNGFDDRVQRFVALYQRQLEKDFKRIRHVDLRYTNGLAVSWDKQHAAAEG